MNRLILIVEGHTEEEFVKKTLRPFLLKYGILSVTPIKVRTSSNYKGGLVSYIKFKNDVVALLKNETDIIVTSLIDYFRLPNCFPKYVVAKSKSNLYEIIDTLEIGMYEDINDKRFIPYIQTHEFEALLFSKKDGFSGIAKLFPKQEDRILEKIDNVIIEYDNPEEINSRPEFAPSKRLESIIPGYNKVLYGNSIIENNGIDIIIEKCPHFREWIKKLIFSLTGNEPDM